VSYSLETIQRMYEHLNWSNQRILETVQNVEEGNSEVIRLFSHILLAEKVWLTRLRGMDSSQLPIWLQTDIETCVDLVKENEESLTTYLTNLSEADLDNLIVYKNSKGTEFTNTIREILTHVALHGQYHRGQINSRLRADGFEPVNVDFITFVRL